MCVPTVSGAALLVITFIILVSVKQITTPSLSFLCLFVFVMFHHFCSLILWPSHARCITEYISQND